MVEIEMNKICQKLAEKMPSEEIFMNEPMSKHTTFKVGGNADIFVKVSNIAELKYCINVAKKNNIHMTFVGNGSNILVKDNGIRGIVVKLEFDKIEIDKKEDIAIVTVGSGVKLSYLSQELLKRGITGFEFASGIPGTIGGAVKMNAGCFGSEMKDIVVSTKCLDLKRYDEICDKTYIDDIEITEDVEKTDEPDIVEFNNEEQKFTYRDSIFSNKRYVILQTKLKLSYGDQNVIKAKMEEFLKSRKDKQPSMPSAGSTFKRGEDYITARLIYECGLKGYSIGGAMVSDKHAGFIVNTGDATAKDILDLIEYVKNIVYEKTGKSIKLEIEILGE